MGEIRLSLNDSLRLKWCHHHIPWGVTFWLPRMQRMQRLSHQGGLWCSTGTTAATATATAVSVSRMWQRLLAWAQRSFFFLVFGLRHLIIKRLSSSMMMMMMMMMMMLLLLLLLFLFLFLFSLLVLVLVQQLAVFLFSVLYLWLSWFSRSFSLQRG